MITVKNLSKTYNKGKSTEYQALTNISFAVNEGEMVAIIGKSGAGKSTLLHILGAIDNYDDGEYKIKADNSQLESEIDISKLNPVELANFRNSHVGIILQDFALIESYSVIDNVLIPLRFSNVKRKEYKTLAMNALKQVGLNDLAKKDVSKLSGGQKQRVAIARALVNNPDFILADEPTGALDSKTTEQIMDVFKELNQTGKTIILVTHDPLVASQCSRIIEISDGKIIS